jgi:WXG100 family type VII secretion target
LPPAGFEVDPDQLDGLAARFRQAAQELNDLGHLASTAAGVDLQGTPSGPAFAQAWEQFAHAYESLAKGAIAIGTKLNQNALTYREADGANLGNLDDPARGRHRNLE